MFVCRWGTRLEVFAIDVQSGSRRPWKTLEVSDPAGVAPGIFMLTRDGRTYAYGYLGSLDELYVVDGLR